MKIFAISNSKTIFILLLGFCALTLFVDQSFADPTDADPVTTLVTQLDDRITGNWLPTQHADVIDWQVDGFQKPFQFELDRLTAIKVHHTDKIPPMQGTYRCELTDGDVLQGIPIAIDETHLTFEIPLSGKVQIERNRLSKLAPWRGAGLAVKSTPTTLKSWQGNLQAWQEAAGRITALEDKAELVTHLRLGNRSQLSLRVAWKNKPDFRLDFGSDAKYTWGLRLETWQDQLVLVAESPFAADILLVKNLEDRADEVALSLFVDTRKQKILVTTDTGISLGQFEWVGGFKSKFRILARKSGLHLHPAIVTPWDGSSPVPHDATVPKIYTKAGKSHQARLTAWNPDTDEWTYSLADDSTPQTISSEQLDSVTFGNPSQAVEGSVQAHSRNGIRMSGSLVKYTDRSIWIQAPGIVQPLALPLSNLRDLIFLANTNRTSAKPANAARIELNGTSILGNLVDSPLVQSTNPLIWKPIASKNAAPIAENASGTILYRETYSPKQKKRMENKEMKKNNNDNIVVQGLVGLFSSSTKETPVISIPRRSLLGPTLHLRSGDSIPCQPKRIDSEGLTFSSPSTDSTFAPHDTIKALVLVDNYQPAQVTKQQRDRLLTLPRIQQDYPPKHLLLSTDGDLLRTRLVAMDDKNLHAEVRLNPTTIPRSKVAAIAWLDYENEEPQNQAEQSPAETGHRFLVQAVQSDGIRLTVQPSSFAAGVLHGESRVFGKCHLEVSRVEKLVFGKEIQQAIQEQSHQLLVLTPAMQPRFVTAEPNDAPDAGKVAALVGKPAPPIKLNRLNGVEFDLADQHGKVIVLDFWASWCGPCVQWMPQLEEIVAQYADKKVELITINLMEDREVVEKAFERMQIQPTTLLDIDGVVAEAYQATAIPQTVVIDKQGNVSRLFVGGSPQIKQPLIDALDELTAVPGAE